MKAWVIGVNALYGAFVFSCSFITGDVVMFCAG